MHHGHFEIPGWLMVIAIFGAIYYFFGWTALKWTAIITGIITICALVWLMWEKGMFDEYF